MAATVFSGNELSLSIGNQILLDNTALSIFEGERVALVGRNGSGKSTLMRILAGKEIAPQGTLAFARNLRVAYLPQEFTIDESRSVLEYIHGGLGYFEELLRRYEKSPHDEVLEAEIKKHNAWNLDNKITTVMEKLNIPPGERLCAELSGGEKRRVALAAAVVGEPDLLLLDEPTNHLDAETVVWIENFLASYRGTCMFVTHDRYFLDRVATRIIELSNGKIYSYDGSYADFLEAKAEREYAEDEQEARRQAFLRSEVEWVRRSPKARLKRNLGRVKRYDEIISQSGPARDREIDLVIPDASHLGNKTISLQNISLSFGDRCLFKDFNFEFEPGSRVGIIGANGTGKTSLLKIITGQLESTTGKVEIAPLVEFNYVDQNRMSLNPELTVFDEIGEGNQFTMVGDRKVSVWTYLRKFLFADDRINTRVDRLSGGERARLMLAKILKRGGNFLILDEPTNDLDLPTLRLLEEALAAYQGCVVVVSHDRYFLNRVCTSMVALDGQGNITSGVGDFDYFTSKIKAATTTPAPPKPVSTAPAPEAPKQRKMTWKEQQELAGMEDKIAATEARIGELEALFITPDFYEKYGTQTSELTAELEAEKAKLETLFDRWEELEELRVKS